MSETEQKYSGQDALVAEDGEVCGRCGLKVQHRRNCDKLRHVTATSCTKCEKSETDECSRTE